MNTIVSFRRIASQAVVLRLAFSPEDSAVPVAERLAKTQSHLELMLGDLVTRTSDATGVSIDYTQRGVIRTTTLGNALTVLIELMKELHNSVTENTPLALSVQPYGAGATRADRIKTALQQCVRQGETQIAVAVAKCLLCAPRPVAEAEVADVFYSLMASVSFFDRLPYDDRAQLVQSLANSCSRVYPGLRPMKVLARGTLAALAPDTVMQDQSATGVPTQIRTGGPSGNSASRNMEIAQLTEALKSLVPLLSECAHPDRREMLARLTRIMHPNPPLPPVFSQSMALRNARMGLETVQGGAMATLSIGYPHCAFPLPVIEQMNRPAHIPALFVLACRSTLLHDMPVVNCCIQMLVRHIVAHEPQQWASADGFDDIAKMLGDLSKELCDMVPWQANFSDLCPNNLPGDLFTNYCQSETPVQTLKNTVQTLLLVSALRSPFSMFNRVREAFYPHLGSDERRFYMLARLLHTNEDVAEAVTTVSAYFGAHAPEQAHELLDALLHDADLNAALQNFFYRNGSQVMRHFILKLLSVLGPAELSRVLTGEDVLWLANRLNITHLISEVDVLSIDDLSGESLSWILGDGAQDTLQHLFRWAGSGDDDRRTALCALVCKHVLTESFDQTADCFTWTAAMSVPILMVNKGLATVPQLESLHGIILASGLDASGERADPAHIQILADFVNRFIAELKSPDKQAHAFFALINALSHYALNDQPIGDARRQINTLDQGTRRVAQLARLDAILDAFMSRISVSPNSFYATLLSTASAAELRTLINALPTLHLKQLCVAIADQMLDSSTDDVRFLVLWNTLVTVKLQYSDFGDNFIRLLAAAKSKMDDGPWINTVNAWLEQMPLGEVHSLYIHVLASRARYDDCFSARPQRTAFITTLKTLVKSVLDQKQADEARRREEHAAAATAPMDVDGPADGGSASDNASGSGSDSGSEEPEQKVSRQA